MSLSVAIALSWVADKAADWLAVTVATWAAVKAAICAVVIAFMASADKFGTWVVVSAGI